MKRPARMVVVPERRGRTWAFAAACAVLVGAIAMATGFVFGQQGREGVDPARFEAIDAALSEQILETERLSRELADSKLAKTVDAGANQALRATIKTLNDDVAALEAEVRFYKRLMAPAEAQRGLRIEQLNFERTPDERRVSYSLLLTQMVDRHRWIQGDVSLDFIGERAGARQVLPLTELTDATAYPLKFRFRYFQDFNGAITLPEGFEPREVLVTARTGSGDGQQLERIFDWSVQES